jgi:hypothetical protein
VRREVLFGLDTPVRVAAASVMVVLGWALARDLGRFTAPALFRRMDPATAATVGFLIRLVFIVAAALIALRVAGLQCRSASRRPSTCARACDPTSDPATSRRCCRTTSRRRSAASRTSRSRRSTATS